MENFEEILNKPAPLNPLDIEATPTDFPINVTPPTIEGIGMAIRQIKSGKAVGPENMPAEALKLQSKITANMHHILFMKNWKEEKVSPTDWEEKYLIK
ncbi:unnamed protein product [Schistosoma curassoni]|uniref:Reverse transcriptase domain-containing protein n=1 Tax=Schistosoma curassoni TaxID=6186 RepID=A0A183KIX6_9TREM|nr:unnamed protein product [Schistosoma curassoni]